MTKYRSRSPRYHKGKSNSIDAIGLFIALLMGAVVIIVKGVPWLWNRKIRLGRLHTNAFIVLLVLALLGSGIYLIFNHTPTTGQRTVIVATPIPTRRPIPTTVVQRTATPRPISPSIACCKHCDPKKSKPCGDSCISLNKTCTQPRGCACSP